MTGLITKNEVQIDSERLACLLEYLNIKNSPSLDNFLALPEDEQNLYGFFIESQLPNCLMIDWKWKPQDLFPRIERALTGHSINLDNVHENDTYPAFDTNFSFNGKQISLTIHDEEPNLLFETLNSTLDGQQFIDINFQGDEYAWLLVSNSTNLQELADLIGFTVVNTVEIKRDGFQTREELQNQPQFTEHFDINKPLESEAMFYPVLYHRVAGDLKRLTFTNSESGETVSYHFTVLEGQRLHDVMTETFHNEISYSGGIEMDWIAESDAIAGAPGQEVPVYNLQVYLSSEVLPAKTPDGLNVSLEDTPEVY
jgi:hypothetical protein